MSAADKTKNLKRLDLPTQELISADVNPNKMTDAEFNMLYDNIEATGITDPILVRQLEDGRFRIIGGHHRWEVAKLMGFETVPCTVIDDPDFDDDAEKFQLVRMNVIHGHMSPESFLKLYEQVAHKYTDDILQESFGFADEKEFKRLIRKIKADLPPELKEAFSDAAKDVRTIDDLASLMNKLMGTFGDTLPYGYMLMDFGGKESIWLRMSNKTKEASYKVGAICKDKQRTMDDVLGGVVQLIADGKLDDVLQQLVDNSKPVVIPATVELPTQDFLDQLK